MQEIGRHKSRGAEAEEEQKKAIFAAALSEMACLVCRGIFHGGQVSSTGMMLQENPESHCVRPKYE